MRRSILSALLLLVAIDATALSPPWPAIDWVVPTTGRPSGGETVYLFGRNFKSPVRVFFKSANGEKIEAAVVSATSEQIVITTPAFALPAERQSVRTEVIVVTQERLETSRENAFEFRNETLTPIIYAAWPRTAPTTGNEIELWGEGFQIPARAQLLRHDVVVAELRVTSVGFDSLRVSIPPNGDYPLYEPFDIRVENLASHTQAISRNAFHYVPAPTIETVTPDSGSRFGGTHVIVEGTALADEYDYTSIQVAGVTATPLLVTPTRIEAMTLPIYDSPCNDVSGPVIVTHTNGAIAVGSDFTYITQKKSIESVPQEPVVAGSTIDVVVSGDAGTPRQFTIGGIAVEAIASHDHVWTLRVPTNLTFPREACFVDGAQGTRLGAQTFELVVSTETIGCQWQDKATISVLPASTVCTARPRQLRVQ